MIDLATLTTFFGWCTVLSLGMGILGAVSLMLFRDFVKAVHSTLFGVDEGELDALYFQYLGNYKIAVIVFNLIPYLALKILS